MPDNFIVGIFRWPFGIAISRSWKFIDQVSNKALVSNVTHGPLRTLVVRSVAASQRHRTGHSCIAQHLEYLS